MYRLGQSYPRPFAGYDYPKKKGRYTPTTGPVQYPVSVTDSVTSSDSIGLTRYLNQRLTDTITTAQTIANFKIRNISLSHSIVVSITEGQQFLVSVSHDVTVAQVIRLGKRIALSV